MGVCRNRRLAGRAGRGGFTLVELMVTLAVLAILLAAAVPSFNALLRNNRLATQSNAFVAAVHLARAEAVKRGVAVSLCPSANQSSCTDSDSWTGGWIVFQDGAAAGTPSTAGAGAEIIRVWYALDGGSSFSGNGTRWLRFGADGAAGWNGNERSQRSFDLEARDCQDDQRRSITVTRLGRVNTERRACA